MILVFVIILHTTLEHNVILNKAHSPGLLKLPKRKYDVNAKFVLLLYIYPIPYQVRFE